MKTVVELSDASNGRYIPGTTVLLNGADVSEDCFRATKYSDGSGVVGVYLRNEAGRYFTLDGHAAVSEWKDGDVVIIPPDDVSAHSWEELQREWISTGPMRRSA